MFCHTKCIREITHTIWIILFLFTSGANKMYNYYCDDLSIILNLLYFPAFGIRVSVSGRVGLTIHSQFLKNKINLVSQQIETKSY